MSRLKVQLIDLYKNKFAWLIPLLLTFTVSIQPAGTANDLQPDPGTIQTEFHENTVLDQTKGTILSGQFNPVKSQLAYQETALLGSDQPRFHFNLPITRDGYYRIYAW